VPKTCCIADNCSHVGSLKGNGLWSSKWPWDIVQVIWFWLERLKVKVRIRVNSNMAWVRTLSHSKKFLYQEAVADVLWTHSADRGKHVGERCRCLTLGQRAVHREDGSGFYNFCSTSCNLEMTFRLTLRPRVTVLWCVIAVSYAVTWCYAVMFSWLGGSVVERRSLTGQLSLICTGPAADGKPPAVGQPTRPTQPFILPGSINE